MAGLSPLTMRLTKMTSGEVSPAAEINADGRFWTAQAISAVGTLAVSTRSFGEPEETRMAQHRGGRTTRREHEDDLQRDDRGTGHPASKGKKELDKELDNTLEDSFPSSDPPAISQPTKTEPAGDPKVKP
jgi:hypothetical protein